ncbi:MAG: hypothetical protein ACKVVP_23150 [Chloroflexota bacterium]
MLVRAAAALGLAIVLVVIQIPRGFAHTCTPDADIPITGTLLLPRGSGLERFHVREGRGETLPILPTNGVVSHVSRSHDGARVALARFSRPDGDSLGGADILISASEGGLPQQVIRRAAPGELLTSPTWMPDGSIVFERSSVAGGAASSSIQRLEPNGANQTIVDRGIAPSVSVDGRALAYVRSDRSDRLIHRVLESGTERVLMDDPGFLALAFPRYSPDGEWVAFAAAGEPERSLGAGLPSRWLGLGVQPVHAHGVPWDIFAVRVADGHLRRLTHYYDDDPSVAWSPDGQWLALLGGESMKVFSFAGDAYYCVSAVGGYGGFDWIE